MIAYMGRVFPQFLLDAFLCLLHFLVVRFDILPCPPDIIAVVLKTHVLQLSSFFRLQGVCPRLIGVA